MIPEYQEQFLRKHMGKVNEYYQALEDPISIEYSSRRYDFIGRFLIALEWAEEVVCHEDPAFLYVLSHYLGLSINPGQEVVLRKKMKL